MFGALSRDHAASSPLAKAALKWVKANRKPLAIPKDTKPASLGWRDLARVAQSPRPPGGGEQLRALVDRAAEALRLDPVDAGLLWCVVAADRLTLPGALAGLLAAHRIEPLTLFGQLNGSPPAEVLRRVRRGDLDRLGLVALTLARDGMTSVAPSWSLNRLLDRAAGDDESVTELLMGRTQSVSLTLDAFRPFAREADLIARLLRGALAGREQGINILLYGPPGTGKTELARTLVAEAGGTLFSVGEADEDGEEPNRWDRVTAYRMAQRVAERREMTALLFDEMEDLIGDARPGRDDYFERRDGSKIFINRLLETNAAPTIWTTNALGNVDPAILRRMSFVLKLDYPSPASAQAMLARLAAEENVDVSGDALSGLANRAPQTGTVLRTALKTGRIAGGGEADAALVAGALVTALRGGKKLPAGEGDGLIDLSLYEADRDIGALVERLASDATPDDFSLLLTGPPGTGKTALAAHLARRLDRPLIVKRASDLLSKWVGETEQLIAQSFEEAVQRGGVLLFDEVDSLLFDRSTARNSWEVTQVNELLTWFERHPLPFIAATNHGQRLDPAALRRFVFKLDLRQLSREKAAQAYARFFGHEAPEGLARLSGITPGDLHVVARQLRFDAGAIGAGRIVELIAAELAAKPEGGARIGF
jgi:transitional endoplasmic reticulum ATPase